MNADYPQLLTLFREELPGPSAHQLMFPRKNSQLTDQVPGPETRLSAVAIILFEQQGFLQSLVIRRTVYEGKHSGQIAFPGGKWEPSDITTQNTALRECCEEIGVQPGQLAYVGKLTDVYTAVSAFLIEPHVFYWSQPDMRFSLSEREVAAIYPISLTELLNDASVFEKDIRIAERMVLRNIPHFRLSGVEIWGATALMLSELKILLQRL